MSAAGLSAAGLVLLVLAGFAAWAAYALVRLEQALAVVGGFEPHHFEIG